MPRAKAAAKKAIKKVTKKLLKEQSGSDSEHSISSNSSVESLDTVSRQFEAEKLLKKPEEKEAKVEEKKEKPKRIRKPKILKVGSKRQVFNGRATKTSGGLKKEDLTKSKSGRIVSLRASLKAQETWKRRHQPAEVKEESKVEIKQEINSNQQNIEVC